MALAKKSRKEKEINVAQLDKYNEPREICERNYATPLSEDSCLYSRNRSFLRSFLRAVHVA